MGLKIISPNTVYLGSATGSGGGGGDSSSFPVTVTDSGSVLPTTAGYNVGDTFLDTTVKKIYTVVAEDIYSLNNATASSGIVDKYTGIASGFSGTPGSSNATYVSKPTAYIDWSGNKSFSVHFKLNSAPTDNTMYCLLATNHGQNTYPYELKGIAVYVKNKKLYFCFTNSGTSPTYHTNDKDLFDYELSANIEYYLTVTKEGTTLSADLFTGGYDGTKIATHSSETDNYYVSSYAATNFWYGFAILYDTNVGSTGFSIGEIYLVDSYGNVVVPAIENNWNSGVDLEDSKSYLSIDKSKLYFYKDATLTEIVDLTPYKFKAQTITIDTATVSISEIKANTNYVFTNNAITTITFTACETSFEETTIEFSTGSTAPIIADSSNILWMDGFDPATSLKANKSYLIVIFNKLGFVKEY